MIIITLLTFIKFSFIIYNFRSKQCFIRLNNQINPTEHNVYRAYFTDSRYYYTPMIPQDRYLKISQDTAFHEAGVFSLN